MTLRVRIKKNAFERDRQTDRNGNRDTETGGLTMMTTLKVKVILTMTATLRVALRITLKVKVI